MRIRPRVDADLPGCVSALRAVHRADGYPARWPVDPLAWLAPAGSLAAWVAEDDGGVAGHVALVGGVEDPVVTAATGAGPERLTAVSRLFVAPPARGLHLGAALLAAACSHATARRLQAVLDVVEGSGRPWRCTSGSGGAWSTAGPRTGPPRTASDRCCGSTCPPGAAGAAPGR